MQVRRWMMAAAITAIAVTNLPAANAVNDGPTPLLADAAAPTDVRTDDLSVAPTAGQASAMGALVREAPDSTIRWNRRFGTPATIIRHGSTLSKSAAGAPGQVARAWLRSHAALFGWSASSVDALKEAKTLTQPNDGAHTVLFHQLFDGLEGGSFGGSLVVALDSANQVLSVRADVVRVPSLAGAARLSPAAAVSAITNVAAPSVVGTRAGWTEFAAGTLAGPQFAKLIAFPSGTGSARRAYEVLALMELASGARAVVDAESGEVLYRTELADRDDARVFENHPGAAQGGQQELQPLKPEWFNGPALTTAGNNASTATNWGVFIAPDGPGQLRPVGSFDHAFTNSWNMTDCSGTGDLPTGYAPDALPAAVNLFYHHNVMHDFFYSLGFDEAAGTMQLNDAKPGGSAGDPLLGLVQAGASVGDAPPLFPGRDNAYMFPMPDGIPQWSGMFLFEPIAPADGGFLAPCVDGDFDAGVIYHEYTHGVTNRWVGGEYGNIDTYQGGSMGESWSDFYALHYLHSHGLQTDTALGAYVTGNTKRGIRNWQVADVPVGFDDLGYDIAGEEVHADGEIWNGVLWDIRTRLAALRGGQPGADLAAQLIADAMPISGPVPSMIDMRDAILAADQARTKGANQDALWQVFARRGMGKSAVSIDANDINPKPGFDHKSANRNGTVSGLVVDAVSGAPIANAKVFVGAYEARVSPAAKASSSGRFKLPILAGTQTLTIAAPGYGARTLTTNVVAGSTSTPRFALAPNVASSAAGATVSAPNPSALGPARLAIDDTESSTWWTDPDADGPNKESLVIDLAGNAPITVKQLQISAMISPAGARFEALKDFEVLASADGKKWTSIVKGNFPTMLPRPVTPDLHYKTFTVAKPMAAKFLKFVGSPQSPDIGTLQLAEIQAFAQVPVTVTNSTTTGPDEFHDEGRAIVSSADGTLTTNLMTSGLCVAPPPTQGVDAWVSVLPDSYADGNHQIDVRAEPIAADPRADVDLYFLSADCRATGSVASTAPRETGTVPQGTKYLVTQLYTTAGADIVVEGKRIG